MIHKCEYPAKMKKGASEKYESCLKRYKTETYPKIVLFIKLLKDKLTEHVDLGLIITL